MSCSQLGQDTSKVSYTFGIAALPRALAVFCVIVSGILVLPSATLAQQWVALPEIEFGAHYVDNPRLEEIDRKSVVEGKSVSVRVDLGGRRIIKKKNTKST